MVGQRRLQLEIDKLIDNNLLYHFVIFVGRKGCGKRTFAKYISERVGATYVEWDSKIDEMRKMIDVSYSNSDTLYLHCIPNYESFTVAAANSILKIVEEPPKNVYIVLTAENKSAILPTILSRGVTLEFDDYTNAELISFANDNNISSELIEYCDTPGELVAYKDLDLPKTLKLCASIYQNIGKASIGNTLKLSTCFSDKSTDKYDLEFCVKIFSENIYFDITSNKYSKDVLLKYQDAVSILSKVLTDLTRNYYKTSVIDKFLLEFREVMYEINRLKQSNSK